MLICSCAVISDHDIRNAIQWMRASDPLAVITPGKVYRALGKNPDCGGCIAHFVATMADEVTTEIPDLKRTLPEGGLQKGNATDEGQRESHRLSESRAAQ